ncbi:MAG TPA: SpoIID/LytB domain-containing protein [Nannocystaceae bacterium]|nr:SpoIID/LytB domain-containing protein [Nannocystaceae bacterium]
MSRIASLALVLAFGCAADDDPLFDRDGDLPLEQKPPIQRIPAPLPAAHCTIDVDGIGTIDMEEDYLPHVVHCENGGAPFEALKAQAIAARSVAYYAIETSGGICDGQGCQVYSCGSDPTPQQIQAVQETSGLYLNYNDTLTYAFFVAGDSGVAGPGCVGDDAAASTEHWVTYNEGKSGTMVEQTELGFVHNPGDSGYGQNRGCMGQWSARCLENDNGYDYAAILRFFYGDDIGITQAPGACVLPLPGESTSSDGGGETTMPADTSGGVDSTGEPPMMTTAPMTTDPSTASAEDSIGEGPLDSEGEGTAADGTGDDGPDALPDTFGEHPADTGCGCTTDPSSATSFFALAFFATLRRRWGRSRN